jgi:hypothetical protein
VNSTHLNARASLFQPELPALAVPGNSRSPWQPATRRSCAAGKLRVRGSCGRGLRLGTPRAHAMRGGVQGNARGTREGSVGPAPGRVTWDLGLGLRRCARAGGVGGGEHASHKLSPAGRCAAAANGVHRGEEWVFTQMSPQGLELTK